MKKISSSVNVRNWLPLEIRLIEEIRKYPEMYLSPKSMGRSRYLKKIYPLWVHVSAKIGSKPRSCKNMWEKISCRYAILKSMIEKGDLSEESAKNVIGLSKYITGRLDYLKPHVEQILKYTDLDSHRNFIELIKNQKTTIRITPKWLHKMILMKEESVQELDNSDMNFLMKTVERAVLESLDNIDLSKIKEKPLEETIEKSQPDEVDGVDGKSIRVDEIDEDVCEPAEDDIYENDTQNVTSDDIIEPEPEPSENNYPPDILNTFLLKYEKKMRGITDIKEYTKDLAEVLCQKLEHGKRKAFLSKVDLLVSKMLEGQEL